MHKTIGSNFKLQKTLPRQTLLGIYKPFIGYYNGDIFDQSYNILFYQELETFQYNTILAIAEVIHATSKEKLSIN